MATVTRRRVLQAAAAGGLALPLVRTAGAVEPAPTVIPRGKMTLAWHTNIASRWLDPQQHGGTATPDNFLFANQDALIKNFRQKRYDHLALAENLSSPKTPKVRPFSFALGSSSTTVR
jgi:hypothetical protein